MFYRLVGVLKGIPKYFTDCTGKHLCRIKCEPKSLIYQCSLHLHYKRSTCTNCFPVSSAEFLKFGFDPTIIPILSPNWR